MDSGAVDVPGRAKKRRSGAGGIQHVPSPFRLAERQYKLYRNPKLQKRLCFSTAVDFRELGANTDAHREKIVLCKEIAAPGRGEEAARTLQVFGHRDRPGFFFVPGALAPREQLQWARQCLAAYPTAPHHTNLGIMPFSLWQADMNKDRSGASKEGPPGSKEDPPGSDGSSGTVTGKRRRTTAEEPPSLLQATMLPHDAAVPPVSKLRWATLGYHYDWTANVYHEGAHWHSPFPQELAEMVTAFTNAILSEPFTPEAAIVNYYQPETMLKAHQDESEFTFDAPIVSFSIGCECIFLLGGTTTDEEPTAVRFRSGDLMFMSGDSRVAFHGVPRILDGTFDPAQFDPRGEDTSSEARRVAEYLSSARININVRQVFPSGSEHTFPTDGERKERLRERCKRADGSRAQREQLAPPQREQGKEVQ